MRRIGLLGSLAATACLALPAMAQAEEITFSGAGVAIPDGGTTTSTIDVSGFDGPITSAKATLGTVTHQNPDDIDSVIVAPNGDSVFLMSDACGTDDMFKTINFEDTAPVFLSDAGPCPLNPYLPSNYEGTGDVPGAVNAFGTAFAGDEPSGTWTLVLSDDTAGLTGSIGSWTLTLDGLTIAASQAGATQPNPERVVCAGRPSTQLGTEGDDEILGTPGPDVISGIGGNDEISGTNGKDVICGGSGKDVLRGGKGKDRLLGQAGKDKLRGGKGNDVLKGGGGKDNVRQ